MIPLCLRLRNFLSYRDNVPPLSFEGIHLACLSGDNGHGKSALLDAITWALWGQARAKSDDDLVNAAATDMEVEFQFLMDGNRYRVLRKQAKARSPRGSGHSTLELNVAQGDGFRPITGDSQRETQAKINQLIRMDYQTFINSAFLLQGRADEFTKKGPAERKKVLADILGLDYYETLETRAKEAAKTRELRGEELRRGLAEMAIELAQRPQWEEQLARSQEELGSLEELSQTQDAALAILREQRTALDLKRRQMAEAKRDLEQATTLCHQAEAQASEHQGRIAAYQGALGEGEEAERGFALLVSSRQRNEGLNQKLALMLGMQEKRARLEAGIQEAHGSLVTQEKVALSTLAELEDRAAALSSLGEELAQAERRLQGLLAQEAESQEKRRRALDLAGQTQGLRGENQKLHAEMQELRGKVDLLDQDQARCPVCETELGESGLRTIRQKYLHEGQARREEYLARQRQVQDLEAQRASLEKELEAEEASLRRERDRAQRQAAAAEKGLAQAQEAARRVAQVGADLDVVRAILAQRNYARAEQTELERLTAEIGALGYQEEEHQRVRLSLDQLAPFEERKRRLEEASLRLPQEQEALQRASEAAGLWQGRLQELEGRMKDLRLDLGRYPDLAGDLERAQETMVSLQKRLGLARQEVGAGSQRLEHCRQLEAQKEHRLLELDGVERERAIYQELAEAFGRKGIQAMIIEAAIPELESEANALLSRMTEGRLQVKLETQRDTKKGLALETLDIRVSDELGTRNYELFSGGEAFRINFALRVALSKLLARRAGAQLRLLVIDEGFGTQDAQGRDRLVEAINSIQDDFDKILVITHIQELKELFPVRIEVVKTAEGSSYYVS